MRYGFLLCPGTGNVHDTLYTIPCTYTHSLTSNMVWHSHSFQVLPGKQQPEKPNFRTTSPCLHSFGYTPRQKNILHSPNIFFFLSVLALILKIFGRVINIWKWRIILHNTILRLINTIFKNYNFQISKLLTLIYSILLSHFRWHVGNT